MNKPRVSAVKYSNTLPLVWGMLKGEQRGEFDLSFVTPSACAEALRCGEADIGLIPSIEYQRMEGLGIIPGISIASKGPARSVLLLSRMPIEQVQSVALDNSSRTSVILLQILLEKFHSKKVKFLSTPPDPEEMLKQADAALIVGDPALTYRGNCSRVYDLGAEWRKFTGLPFVYAFWAGRGNANLAGYRKIFEASKEFGLSRLEDIIDQEAAKVPIESGALRDYLGVTLDYSLDEENCRGLQLFYRLAEETGALPRQRELDFV